MIECERREMRIEAIDLFYVALPVIRPIADGTQDSLVVRARADNGLEGWGECDASPLVSLAAYVMPMSHANMINIREALLGETCDSPEDVRRLRAKVGRYALDVEQIDHAVSGVDIALWDLVGKQIGEPVWRLLGYQSAHRKTPYGSVLFDDTPDATRQTALELRRRGYLAAKFGWGPFGRGSAEADEELVAAAREGLGPDARLMVDAGVAWGSDAGTAAERSHGLAKYDLTWLEEPLLPDEVDAYRRLKESGPGVPIAAGEGSDFLRSAEDLMVNGQVDYVQIDVGRIGGITVADRVCRRARQLGVQYVNHTFKSHLSVAASVHVFAGVPEFDLVEYPAGDSPLIRGLTEPTGVPMNEDGTLDPPESPGLGVRVSPDALRRYLKRVRIEIDGQCVFESPEP
ncbi:MAG: mandelate racemase/muconate lactonizing enzyme family protein [Chloroflexota bacterium]